jgi:hypothetical protein
MRTVFLSMLLILTSCAKDPFSGSGGTLRTNPQLALSTETLKGLRVKELFVVLFPKDYSMEEWKEIFDQTRILSRNKRRLRELEGRTDDPSQEERFELIGKNAEILTFLGGKSLFMMSWSAADENCRIRDTLKISCRPASAENPLNGGMPKTLEPIAFVEPDPVRSEVKTPYLAIRLEQNNPEAGPAYSLDLRLKVEALREEEKWFKGEAIPGKGSAFPTSDGTPASNPFPYGYAELTLGK